MQYKLRTLYADRLRFGSNNLYIFRKPSKSAQRKKAKEMSYEDAQQEILKYSGLDIVHGLKLLLLLLFNPSYDPTASIGF